jgi:hypothetical protein
MYSNLMTNSNYNNANPNKANNGTEMAERSGTSSQKKGKLFNYHLLYFTLNASNVFARCGKIPGRTYINFKLL